MAFNFTKSISEVNVLNAYNNNVVEFQTTLAKTATKTTITIGGLSFAITPISNVFYFNFKDIVKSLVNNNFKDLDILFEKNRWEDQNSNWDLTDFNWEADEGFFNTSISDSNLYKSYSVVYTTEFDDTTTEQTTQTYHFFKSVEQINNVITKPVANSVLMNQSNLVAFKNYPFDVSFYSQIANSTVTNLSNLNSYTDTLSTTEINRLIFNDYAFIDNGFNNIRVAAGVNVDFTLNLKDTCTGGTYLKWFNEFGGWSYWLFNSIHKESISAKTIDVFNVDFESINNTNTTNLITGKAARKTRDIKADSLTVNEVDILKSIITSPRVEMFDGTFGNFENKWQNIKVKDGSFQISNTKRNLLNLKLKIEINQYTQV